MKVLVVEDDAGLAEVLTQALSKQYYQVEVASDGQLGWDLVESFEYDLVLLDLHLPKLDGINFCRQLRAAGYDLPVLLMTAEDTRSSKITGLDAGADDYVLKPLDLEELMARIRALLRRGCHDATPILTWGELSLNPSSCEVVSRQHPLQLTHKEYEILELLLRYPHRVFSLNVLIERLWALDKTPSENAVRTHIKSLRRKLKQADITDMIETVYGLGYRLNPDPNDAKPTTDSAEVNASTLHDSMTNPVNARVSQQGDQILDPLREIWERHQQKYWSLIAELAKAIPVLQGSRKDSISSLGDNQALLARAQTQAHTLKGALGSFGFTTGSQIASQIEQIVSASPLVNDEQLSQLSILIEQLRKSLLSPQSSILSRSPSRITGEKVSCWLIIDNDSEFVETLIHQASIWGIQTYTATTPDEARQAWRRLAPDVILLDPDFSSQLDDGLMLLSEIRYQQPALPVVVATAQDTLPARIKVLRSGGCTFLQKPVTAERVLETVNNTLSQTTLQEARILALDDDPQILLCLEQLLGPWGFQLKLVSDPIQFWDALEQDPPDLLILDIEMPDFNGLELCQVIRSDPALCQLPILFLSAHTDPNLIRQVFESGADDYISKPIIGPELVARILSRLERVKLLHKLAGLDDLTRLSRRGPSVESLNRLLKLATRQKTTLCFALLDLDRFKQVNDHYGHGMGDQVLQTLAEYLRQTFRGEDVVARWGGEEFVVGLYNVSQTVALKRLRALLKDFNQHAFLDDRQHRFYVSFSGGIAMYPEDGRDIQTLYRGADQALYSAKAKGRNQILPNH